MSSPHHWIWVIFYLTLLPLCQGGSWFIRGRPPGGLLRLPKVHVPERRGGPLPDRWLTQKVDQMNYADKRTWQQRYYMNTDSYKKGGPIFLMLGGEEQANPDWLHNGQWVNLAMKYQAMLLFLEHRFYGQSRPTDDLSTDNLQYLTVEQVLADTANFRTYISNSLSLANDTKWIVFGGSYPGNLAAWFRLKYPNLVDGAIASSAPVYALKNFKDFLVGTAEGVLIKGSSNCYSVIENATQTILNYTTMASGRAQLSYILTLCEGMSTQNPMDLANLFSFLSDTVGEVVQFNNVAREFTHEDGWAISIKVMCQTLTSQQPYSRDPIYRYEDFLQMWMKAFGMSCFEYKYSKMVEDLKSTDWSSDVAEGARQWLYQSCTEFGFFANSESKNQPFGNNFPDSFFVQQCKDIFNKDEYVTEEGIHNILQTYGGYNPNMTHAIFVNGNIDPWRDLSVTESLPGDVTAINIPGASHCADMYPDSPMDTVDLVQARLQIDAILERWLKAV